MSRDTDYAIGEKVFGWRMTPEQREISERLSAQFAYGHLHWMRESLVCDVCGRPPGLEDFECMPKFSTDMQATWLLIDKLGCEVDTPEAVCRSILTESESTQAK